MSTPVALVVGVLLLAANAFFVGGEFAVISARRSQIEPLAERGSRAARTAPWRATTPGPTKLSAAIQTSSSRVMGRATSWKCGSGRSCVPVQRWACCDTTVRRPTRIGAML